MLKTNGPSTLMPEPSDDNDDAAHLLRRDEATLILIKVRPKTPINSAPTFVFKI